MAGLPAISLLPAVFDSAGLPNRLQTDHWRAFEEPRLLQGGPPLRAGPRGDGQPARGGTGGLRKSRNDLAAIGLIAKTTD